MKNEKEQSDVNTLFFGVIIGLSIGTILNIVINLFTM